MTDPVDPADLADALAGLLELVRRGDLSADTPAERRFVRHLEGALAAAEVLAGRRESPPDQPV